jgi:transcription termination factor Rho
MKTEKAHKLGGTCMNLKELKAMRIGDLTEIAKTLHVDGAAGLKKQELIFAILQAQTDQEVIVSGEGVLEVLPDGYGFLRSPDCAPATR